MRETMNYLKKATIFYQSLVFVLLGPTGFFARNLGHAQNNIVSTSSEQFEYEKFLTMNIESALVGIAVSESYMVQVQVEVIDKLEKTIQEKLFIEKMPITKLGVWANPKSFIEAHMNDLQIKAKPKKSFRSLINKVRVDISLDHKLKPELDEQVKKIAESVIKGSFFKPVTVNVGRLRLIDELHQVGNKSSFFSRNQMLSSLIALGLILLGLGLYATSQFYDLGVKKLEKVQPPLSFTPFSGLAQVAPEAKKVDDGEFDVSTPGIALNGSMAEVSADYEDDVVKQAKKTMQQSHVVPIPQDVDRGGEQFKLLITTDPKRAGHLIKQWISANNPNTNEALSVIPRLLNLEVLSPIFQLLDDTSRMRWKEIINEPVKAGAYERADQVLLAQTTSSLQVSRMFSLLPKENINFASTAIDLIPELAPDLEFEVFTAIIKTNDKCLLKKAAMKYFPAQLLHKLPEEMFREILSQRPLAERIEIIYIAGDTLKDIIRGLVASSDKMGEMLDFQLMQIEADENLKKRLDKNKPKIWRQFIYSIRDKIHGTEFIAEAAEAILDKWIEEY
jgi:hypothetical protein